MDEVAFVEGMGEPGGVVAETTRAAPRHTNHPPDRGKRNGMAEADIFIGLDAEHMMDPSI